MSLQRRRVQPRVGLWPTLAAVVVVLATLWLGRWQLQRAAQKTALQAALVARQQAPRFLLGDVALDDRQAEALRFRPAQASGVFLPQAQIYIDNRERDGVPGYHVLTPLQLGQRVLLVNRGFVARDRSYPKPPAVPVPSGEQTVTGQFAPAQTRYVELSADVVSGPVWQNLQLAHYAAVHHLQVQPVVLLADQAAPGLQPVHETPDAGINTHLGYAFQWFSLAATTLALYLYFSFFRPADRPS